MVTSKVSETNTYTTPTVSNPLVNPFHMNSGSNLPDDE